MARSDELLALANRIDATAHDMFENVPACGAEVEDLQQIARELRDYVRED